MSWVRYLWFPRVNGVGLLSPPSSVLNLHFLTHVFQAIKFETDILSLNAHILRQWPLLSGGSFFNLIYCPIVDLQCCISFCCMQSELFIHRHISTLFQILFPYRLLQSIEQSSLCHSVGSHQLSILYISSVQSLSHVQLSGTPWTVACLPGFPVIYHLLELAQIHAH